jgi:hypothetical protein
MTRIGWNGYLVRALNRLDSLTAPVCRHKSGDPRRSNKDHSSIQQQENFADD